MGKSMAETPEEHPFAPSLRILAKGKTGSRNLTEEEAFTAFSMILNGEVEDIQLGAFLMLLRVKEETAEEQAGFVRAIHNYMALHSGLTAVHADIDWPSYAGKKKFHPWYILAALLLAENGYRIFMHGSQGHTAGRLYTATVFEQLSLPIAREAHDVARLLDQHKLCYYPLAAFCRPLERIIQLRNTFGVRSPVHSLVRLINPLSCSLSLQSVFHPAYAPKHIDTAVLSGQNAVLVIKGDGGEFEMRPNAKNRLHILEKHDATEEIWQCALPEKTPPEASLDITTLTYCWRGKHGHPYGEAAIIQTCAAILRIAKSLQEADAIEQARQLWDARNKNRI